MAQPSITFESHLVGLNESARVILLDLRGFVRSLGQNVIEEIRPHRIVYAKTMNFRTFLDVQPAGDSLVLSIKSGRTTPPSAMTLRTSHEADAAKKLIADAYKNIQ